MSGTDEILAEQHEAVLLLTLNRPEQLNAWTPTMRSRYVALLERADRDPSVRVVVLTGSGSGFCAGSDITAPPDSEDLGTADTHHRLSLSMRLRKPVISAINGAASGAGLAAALFTDVRFTTPEAGFTTAFSRDGMVAEHGLAWLLPKLVGLGTAMDLLLSARTIDGTRAHELGLVDRVVPSDQVLAETMEYAATLARECSPASMAAVKQRVYSGLDTGLETAVSDAGLHMITALRGGTDPTRERDTRQRHEPGFPPLD
ncbi:Enoyl-CoA hydratase/carnithine racemase [Actinopolyspora xinjiangensis]|uniref:Enoyl-CoA hydratase/carnithine racemase n=1 Tax=Actinopolyspora xinjiangensis TaxID=405564 RepID=A0A1H0WLX1_9ACTN|nr:enoyl-CoA hydratase-related protein [Actinopolyspora xinjiangensis]SDP91637.1 Enoyl-CoA hydratase/carnithine racemase [Actinopolyspora xinjiangensis]